MPSSKALSAAAGLAGIYYDGLEMFRAMPQQLDVIQSDARELLVAGSNRAGKSLILAARFAAIARDKVIYDADGNEFNPRLKHQQGRPLLMWVVAQNWDKVGDTIFRLLFRPGAYKIIRDLDTCIFRAFDPVRDADRDPREVQNSFPLIPMSQVAGGLKGISWEKQKDKQFKRLELLNGTVIRAFASTGEVATGDPVDEIWIDEKFAISSHYPEWQARLIDNDGRITLSTINYADPSLYEIRQRADEQAQDVSDGIRTKQNVRCISLYMRDNPFLSDESKKTFSESLSEEERQLRVEGMPIIGSLRIYQDFLRSIHCAIYAHTHQDDEISKILRDRNGQPPADWTREFVLDPGTLRPYVLFGAVPPQKLWADGLPYFVVYDEIYEPRLTASQFASKVKAKLGEFHLHRMIIDAHAGRQTHYGRGESAQEHYQKALQDIGVVCHKTGLAQFIPGDPNFESRAKCVERALMLRKCGFPQLRIVIDRCPALVRQLEGNLFQTIKAVTGEELPTKKPARQKDDAREGLEYWLSRNPTWVEPPKSLAAQQPQWELYKSLEERFKKQKNPGNIVNIGPGTAS
jgi:hypothetical protein